MPAAGVLEMLLRLLLDLFGFVTLLLVAPMLRLTPGRGGVSLATSCQGDDRWRRATLARLGARSQIEGRRADR
jgi:hypothetical protein